MILIYNYLQIRRALGCFGADAKDAAGPLSGLLKDDDVKLRSAADEALRKIVSPKRP